MKKKFFASILASALALSSLISVAPVNAAATDEVGGLDFYSITFHYENQVLVNCDKTNFSDESKHEYVDKLVINAGTTQLGNYYQVQSDDGISSDCYYSRIPKHHSFITHITNGSAINTTTKFDLLGLTDPYDSQPYVNQNPNIQYDEDGYAFAKEVNEDGTHCKIDQNGFILYSDNIWRTSDGKRVEPFIQIPVVRKTGVVKNNGKIETEIVLSDEYEWVAFDERFDENGKIVNTKNLGYTYMLTKEEYEAFLADENQKEMKLYRASDEETAKQAYRKSKNESYSVLCLVNSDPKNAADFATDKVFTDGDIVKDANGYITFASPRMGTPLSSVKIKDVTIELDALGAEIYEDLSKDPQQKNTIKVSLNDCGYNAEQYQKWYQEGLYTPEEFAELNVTFLGSAKSQTTRTSIETDKKNYVDGLSPTTKSISLELNQEALNNIPNEAQIFVDFAIAENQPAEAYDETYKSTFIKEALDSDTVYFLTEDDKPTVSNKPVAPDSTKDEDSGISTPMMIIGGICIVVVIAAVVIIILVKNKKVKDVNDENKNESVTNNEE